MKHDKEVQKAIDERFGKLYKNGKTTRYNERLTTKKYRHQRDIYKGKVVSEPPMANPDVLSDEDIVKTRQLADERLYDLVLSNLHVLTKKEKRVLEYLASGKTMKQTGKALGYTVSAIWSFLNKVRKKFDKIKYRIGDTDE